MTRKRSVVIGGVDTHKDVHVAAVIDERGKIGDTASFSATAKGYRELLAWLGSFGELAKVGVEGTGAYGAGLARHLGREGVEVVEVNRPNRQARRRRGKSDTVDAEAAAHAARAARFQMAGDIADPVVGTKRALRTPARRYKALNTEMAEMEATLGQLTARATARPTTPCGRSSWCGSAPATRRPGPTSSVARLRARAYGRSCGA